jgi:hypothetical protein
MQRNVEVSQTVQVTVDEAKFTPEFMAKFRASMYPFQTIERHIEYLGQLHARGLADEYSFIEGYGQAADFGIRFRVVDGYQEITGPYAN